MGTHSRDVLAPDYDEDKDLVAPPRVTIARPTVRPADVFDFAREPIDPRKFRNPAIRRTWSSEIARAEKAAELQRRTDEADAAEAQRAQIAQAKTDERMMEEGRKAELKRVNAANEAAFRTAGVENYVDSYGVIQPVRHQDGRVRFNVGEDGFKVVRQGKDPATGNHYKIKIDAYGEQQVEDANQYNVFDDEPSVVYRGGPNASKKPGDRTGWEKFAPLDDAAEADSPALRATALTGKSKLKERLLQTAVGEAERERIQADLGLEQWRNNRSGTQQRLKEIETEASALSAAAEERDGGIFGFNKKLTGSAEQAKQRIAALQSEAQALREQVGDVTSEDAAIANSPEATALMRKRSTRSSEIEGFRKLVDTEGDVLRAARKFRDMLPEAERKTHPILVALAAEKQRLGLREPTDPAATPEEREKQLAAWEQSPDPGVQSLAKRARNLDAKAASLNGNGIVDPAQRMQVQQQLETESEKLQKDVESTYQRVQDEAKARKAEQAKAFAEKRLIEANGLLGARMWLKVNQERQSGDYLPRNAVTDYIDEISKGAGFDGLPGRDFPARLKEIEDRIGGPDMAPKWAEHAQIIDQGRWGVSPATREFIVADTVYSDPKKLGALRRDIREKNIPGLQTDAQVAEALDLIDQQAAATERAAIEQARKLPGWAEAEAAVGPGADPAKVLAKWKTSAGAGEILFNAVRKLGGGAVGLLESAAGGANLWARDKANAVAEWSGADWMKSSPEDFADVITKWLDPQQSLAGAIGGRPNPRLDGVLSQAADTVGQQLPGLLAAFLISRIPGGKGVAGKAAMAQTILSGVTYGLQNAASNYSRIFESMVTRDESGAIIAGGEEAHQAALSAFTDSFAVGVSELAPLELVFRKIPMKGMQSMVGHITQNLAAEITQEVIATKLNNVITSGASGGAAQAEELPPETIMAMTLGMGAVITPAVLLKGRSQARWMTRNAAGIKALENSADAVPAVWQDYTQNIAPTQEAVALGALSPTDPEITAALQQVAQARAAAKSAKSLEEKVAATQNLHAVMSQHAPTLDRIVNESERSAQLNEASGQIGAIDQASAIARMQEMGIPPEQAAQFATPQYIQRQKDRAAGLIKLANGRPDLLSKAEETAVTTDYQGNKVELVYDHEGAPIIEERARQALIKVVPAAQKLFPATEVERKAKVTSEKKAAETAAKAPAGAAPAAPAAPTVTPAPMTAPEAESDQLDMGPPAGQAAPAAGVMTTNAIDPATFNNQQRDAVNDFGTWLIDKGVPADEAAAIAAEFTSVVPSLSKYKRSKNFVQALTRLGDFAELRGWRIQADGSFAKAAATTTQPAAAATAGATTAPSKSAPNLKTKDAVNAALAGKKNVSGLTVEFADIPFTTKTYIDGALVPDSGTAKILDGAGRKIVVATINGVRVPFYLSTGHGGKADVTSGRWYPVFGISGDGWLNKLSGKQINDYYGSPELREVSEWLNANIGDVRSVQTDRVAFTSRSGILPHVSAINEGLVPAENERSDTFAKVQANIDATVARVKAASAAAGWNAPAGQTTSPQAAASGAPAKRGEPVEPYPVDVAETKVADAIKEDMAKHGVEVTYVENSPDYQGGMAYSIETGKIQIDVGRLMRELQSLPEAKHAARLKTQFNEEVVHAVQMRAAKAIHAKHAKPGEAFVPFLRRYYGDMWNDPKEFSPELRAAIIDLRGGTDVPGRDDWKLALEGIRMLVQQRASGTMSEEFGQWVKNLGAKTLETLRAMLAVLKQAAASDKAIGARVKDDIAAIESLIAEAGVANSESNAPKIEKQTPTEQAKPAAKSTQTKRREGLEKAVAKNEAKKERAAKKAAKAKDKLPEGTDSWDTDNLSSAALTGNPGFYSKLERSIEATDFGQTNAKAPEQWIAFVKRQGVQADELKWSGIVSWLETQKAPLTKAQVLDYVRTDGAVRFEEVRAGAGSGTWGYYGIDERPRAFDSRVEAEAAREADIEWANTEGRGSFVIDENNRRAYFVDATSNERSMPYGQDDDGLWQPLDDEWLDEGITTEELQALYEEEQEKSAQEYLDMISDVELDEDSPGSTQYKKHALPGGENYREVVLAMPRKDLPPGWSARQITKEEGKGWWELLDETGKQVATGRTREQVIGNRFARDTGYTSPHFENAPNYVAHYRAQDFGDGTLIEELQADRHQEGRKKGYGDMKRWGVKNKAGSLRSPWFPSKQDAEDFIQKHNSGPNSLWRVVEDTVPGAGIPDAPYREASAWSLALFKRALRESVETGKEWIGWPAGSVVADRFSLRKQIDSVMWESGNIEEYNTNVLRDVRIDPKKGPLIKFRVDKGGKIMGFSGTPSWELNGKQLDDVFGKELANKIMGEENGYLAEEGLNIGGEGMRAFYDQIVPSAVNKFVKQWGAKVERGGLPGQKQHVGANEFKEWYKATQNPNITGLDLSFAWHHSTEQQMAEARAWLTKSIPIWRIAITPEMRKSVQEQGLSLFSAPVAKPTKAEAAFNFTVATSRNRQVAKLLDEGRWDEVHRLNDLAVKHAMSDLPGVTVRLEPVVGRYQGPADAEAFQEPASRVVVTYKDDADLGAIRARMADLSQLWDQDELHEVSAIEITPSIKIGVTLPDGTTPQPAYEIETGDMTSDEVGALAREVGINGLSMAAGRVLLYNAGPEAYQFLDAAQQLIQRIADVRGIQPASKGYGIALRRYGRATDPAAGIIGYEDSRLRSPEQAGALNRLRTALSRRIPELTQRIFAAPKARSFFTKKDVTPRQVELQKRIADVFETLPDDDLGNPVVARAYEELNKDLVAQWDVLTSGPDGLRFYFENYFRQDPLTGERIGGDLYGSSKDAVRDLRERRMLRVLKTDPNAFGPQGVDFSFHPILRDSGRVDAEGTPLSYNDVLRAVHDALAHGMFADQFGAIGEEAAWNVHIRTIDNPWSRWALTTETRAQNSWVNYGPQMRGSGGQILQPGEPGYLSPQDRSFGPQKAALLPLEFTLTGDAEVDAPTLRLMDELGDDARGSADETLASAPVITAAVPRAKELAKKDKEFQKAYLEEFWPKILRQTKALVNPTKQGMRKAVESAVLEVEPWLKENPRFADYYHTDWDITRRHLEQQFPQVKANPELFRLFRVFSGLNSPNTMLPSNMGDAVNSLNEYIRAGNFDDLIMGPSEKGNLVLLKAPFTLSGTTGGNKARTMKIVDRLIREKGSITAAIDFLQEPVDYATLTAFNREMGYKGTVGGIGAIRKVVREATGQDELIPRMMIFGQKVGAYTLNALGDDRFTTTDIWEARFIRSYFRNGFASGTGLPKNVSDQDLMQSFASEFNQRWEARTGTKLSPSAAQAVRWFFIIDQLNKAGYTSASTNDTISGYTKRAISRLGLSQPYQRGWKGSDGSDVVEDEYVSLAEDGDGDGDGGGRGDGGQGPGLTESLASAPVDERMGALPTGEGPVLSRVDIRKNGNVPTVTEIRNALKEDQKDFTNVPINPGRMVGVRLDIPAFERTLKKPVRADGKPSFVVTVHERWKGQKSGSAGPRIGYYPKARINGPITFPINPTAAWNIKNGKAKSTIATAEGTWAEDQSIPSDLDTWTQAGMNPRRHAYFYDRATGRPVVGGSEAVIIGNTVFVKDPEFGSADDFLFSSAITPEQDAEYVAAVESGVIPADTTVFPYSERSELTKKYGLPASLGPGSRVLTWWDEGNDKYAGVVVMPPTSSPKRGPVSESEMNDRRYFALVESYNRGNPVLDEIQRMVNAAAKAAGIKKAKMVATYPSSLSLKELTELDDRIERMVKSKRNAYWNSVDQNDYGNDIENLATIEYRRRFTTAGDDTYEIETTDKNTGGQANQLFEIHNGEITQLGMDMQELGDRFPSDPVTYRPNGELIPLSQRFNPSSDSILNSSAITPAKDAEYLAAVERGDNETVKRLVQAAYSDFVYSHVAIPAGNELRYYPVTYLRFGDVPTNDTGQQVRSTGFNGGVREKGVSVIGAWFDPKRGKYLLPSGSEQADAGIGELVGQERPVYVVKGKTLEDVGSDGEPLLEPGSVKVIKKVALSELVEENNPYETLDGEEYDPGIPGSVDSYHGGRVKWWRAEGIPAPSVRDVVRDAAGNVIPLSQRFNPSSDSILYSSSITPAQDSLRKKPLDDSDYQAYFDFNAVPKEKAKKGKAALKAAGVGAVPIESGGTGSASVAEQRAKAERAWRGLVQGTATADDRAAALAAIEQGPVSSILHEFVRRDIPVFQIRGAKVNTAADFWQLALAVRSPFFESIKIAVLDENNTVIGSQIALVGTLDESYAPMSQIIAAVDGIVAANPGAKPKGWIISHNHPSGNPNPSQGDIDLTNRLVPATQIAKLPLLDHVVTNGESYFSFAENGMVSVPIDIALAQSPMTFGKIADWEVVERSKLSTIFDPGSVHNISNIIKTADPDHAHLIYVGTKHQVMAVERVEMKDAVSQILRGAGREGSKKAFIVLPTGADAVALKPWIKQVANEIRKFGLQVLDIAAFNPDYSKFISARGEGLFEADGQYTSDTFSLGRAVTPEQDAEYLAAVERGDNETVKRLVQAAYSDFVYSHVAIPVGNEVRYYPVTYLRFGDVPTNDTGQQVRSTGFNGGVREKGVSVIGAWFDPNRGKYLLPSGSEQADAGIGELVGQERPVYVVKGKTLKDVGSDGEPLLEPGSVEVIKKVALSELVEENNPYETLDGEEYDPGIPGSVDSYHGGEVKWWRAEGIPAPSVRDVVRDAAGNVIPLSQRFNESNDSFLYSAPATPPPDPAKLGTWSQGPLRAVGVPEDALNRGTVAIARWAGNKAKDGANAISLPAAVAKLAGTGAGKRVGQVARIAQEQLLPKTLVPREVAAWILEARAAIGWSARVGEDLMETIKKGGEAKYTPGFIVPDAGKDSDVQRTMARYFRGEIPIDQVPAGVREWAKQITKLWDDRGRKMVDAGIMSWEAYSARRSGDNRYFPHLYVEDELNQTGVRWASRKLKMFLDRVKPQLSTAWYIYEKNPVDNTAMKDKFGVPKLVEHDKKQWRFNSAKHRDEWFKNFVRQETVKRVRASGIQFEDSDLTALALQSNETQALVSALQSEIRARYGMGEPTDLETLERAGLITNLSYVVPKSLAQMDHDIALAKVFGSIADNPAYTADVQIAGFKEMPNDRRFGKLAGKWVDGNIYQELIELSNAGSLAGEIYDKTLAQWKMWKTVYNPSTHFRNVLGNMFFADLAGVGMHIAPAVNNWRYYRDAWKALKGDLPEAPLQELYESGLLGGDYASAELQSALSGIPFEDADGKPKNPMEVMMAAPWRAAKGVGAKMSAAYELEDSLPKVAAYLKARRGGMSVPEAVAHVRKWFPYYDQVGRSATIRATKRLASPFLSFMQEAVRIGGAAMMEKPITFAKWMAIPGLISQISRLALGLDDDDWEAVKRDLKGQAFGMPMFSALMPIPDSNGNLVQWDFSNVIPYADMLGQRMGESQDKPMWTSMIHKYFLSGPLTQLAIAWGQGRDPFTGKDFKQTDMSDAEALAAQMMYTGKLLLPPLTPGIGTSDPLSVLGGPDRTGRFMQERSRTQEAARKFAGIDVKGAEPNLFKSADEFRKANGLPQPPEFNDSTAKSRIRKEVYDALVQSDVKALAEKLVDLRKRSGDTIASPQDINRLFYYRRPDAIIARKDDREAWKSTLTPRERKVLDKANTEFERVRRNAMQLIRQAEALKPELKAPPSRKPLTTAAIFPTPGPRPQSPAGIMSRQAILPA